MLTQEIELLSDISSRLNSDLDIDRVLADVLALTVERVGASNGSVLIFDEQGSVVHKILARAGMAAGQAQAVVQGVLSQGLAGWVVAHREAAIVPDVLTDPRWINFPDDVLQGGAAISVPLVRRDRVVGVLTLRHPDTGHFTAAHLALLSSIAGQAVIAIENARLFHAAQAEKARLEAIIDGAGDAIVTTDEGGRVTLMNASARQAFGRTHEDDLSGRPLAEVLPSPALDELWKRRETLAFPSTAEVPLPNGHTLYASLAHVTGVGYVIVMQDITYLKEVDRLRTEFVSAVSHDLRSPLQLVLTYTGLLLDSRPMNEQQRQYVHGINRGVSKMVALVEDMLDLARIESGVGMSREECRLDQVAAEVATRFRELIQSKGLSLHMRIPSDLPPVQANPKRVDQVISNLVDNAAKYTRSGAITITASADEHDVVVHVSDTGIGLKPQEQVRLFTKFYRAGNQLTREVEGTGLGLVVAKTIVEGYGGKIWVQSAWRRGSTFSFSLPRNNPG